MKALLIVILSWFSITTVIAERFYVSDDALGGGNGDSWGSAFRYLQDALDQTVSGRGDEVWIEGGTYYPDDGTTVTEEDREASFTLVDGVTLYGGFEGTETSLDGRNVEANVSILSGEIIAGDSNQNAWSIHVLRTSGFSILDGIVVEKGNANLDTGSGSNGGGALSSGGVLTIKNCLIKNNLASSSGGGISGEIKVSNSVFIQNFAELRGGAISGKVQVEDCIFEGNSAGESAGAINGIVEAISSSFIGNSAKRYGGVFRGIIEASDCTFIGNSTEEKGGVAMGNFNANNCLFENNSATEGGVSIGSALLEKCTLTSNSSLKAGGALVGDWPGVDGAPTAKYCIFENNSSIEGGAVYNGSSISCIFINNSATSGGAAYGGEHINSLFLENKAETGGAAFGGGFTNCSFMKNTSLEAGGGGALDGEGVIINSVLSGNFANGVADSLSDGIVHDGPNLIDITPDFSDPENFIGPDLIWGTADDGLRPIKNGNLVDVGDKDAFPQGVEKDLAGFVRIQGAEIDLGSYEFGDSMEIPFTLVITDAPIGSGTVSESGNGSYEDGTTATLTPNPSLGYFFSSWGGDASGSTSPLELVMDANKFVTASFIQDSSDTDSDGLSRYDELVTYGTDPNNPDSDGDGILDGDEVGTIFNPNVDDTATLQLLAAKPQLYLDLTMPELSQLVAFDEVVIQESDNGDFVITIRLLTSGDLATWNSLDLSGAIVDGDKITVVVSASDSVEFLRFSGGE
ncbi:hypothetical protein MLD52_21455 [Puniceicoccaceae bacterium K14]|nr:hypothetical protein [Puniceicoccaceae bacterium K14]